MSNRPRSDYLYYRSCRARRDHYWSRRARRNNLCLSNRPRSDYLYYRSCRARSYYRCWRARSCQISNRARCPCDCSSRSHCSIRPFHRNIRSHCSIRLLHCDNRRHRISKRRQQLLHIHIRQLRGNTDINRRHKCTGRLLIHHYSRTNRAQRAIYWS